MDVNIADVKKIDIVGFLRGLGIEPTKCSEIVAWYHAPYRVDRHPSFKVNRQRNIWYDFGTGKCGDIIDLGVLLYESRNIVNVMQRIVNMDAVKPIVADGNGKGTVARPGQSKLQIVSVDWLSSPALFQYFKSRHIPEEIAVQHCVEVHFGPAGQEKYFGIGFENMRGGYEIRNEYFKGLVGAKDVSLIQLGKNNKECIVFEGYFDFLSYLTLLHDHGVEPFSKQLDCLVLNSVSCRSRALPYLEQYQTVVCCLDNDDAGRRTVEFLAEARDGVQDVSKAYEGYKDLNDYLCGKKFCP